MNEQCACVCEGGEGESKEGKGSLYCIFHSRDSLFKVLHTLNVPKVNNTFIVTPERMGRSEHWMF